MLSYNLNCIEFPEPGEEYKAGDVEDAGYNATSGSGEEAEPERVGLR